MIIWKPANIYISEPVKLEKKKKKKDFNNCLTKVVYLALGGGLAAHCDLLQVVKMAEVFGWRE